MCNVSLLTSLRLCVTEGVCDNHSHHLVTTQRDNNKSVSTPLHNSYILLVVGLAQPKHWLPSRMMTCYKLVQLDSCQLMSFILSILFILFLAPLLIITNSSDTYLALQLILERLLKYWILEAPVVSRVVI